MANAEATKATPPDPAAVEAAKAAAAAAETEAETQAAKAKVVAKSGPVPLGPNDPVDALGVPLKGDADERRAQQRAAVQIRAARVDEDVTRVLHGQEPKWNDNAKPIKP